MISISSFRLVWRRLHEGLLIELFVQLFADKSKIVHWVGNAEKGRPEFNDVVQAKSKVNIVSMSRRRRLEHFHKDLLGHDHTVYNCDWEVKNYVVAEEHGGHQIENINRVLFLLEEQDEEISHRGDVEEVIYNGTAKTYEPE